MVVPESLLCLPGARRAARPIRIQIKALQASQSSGDSNSQLWYRYLGSSSQCEIVPGTVF